MATVRKWSGVAVAMESALGADKTISAIALDNTGTVTGTHDFAAGDFVKFDVLGTYQLNGRVFRVKSVSTTVSFVVEDTSGAALDMSGFDTFVSGTVNKITFGTSITTAADVSASGGDFDFIDTTTIHDNIKTQIPGTANPLAYTMNQNWDASDAGQIAMKAASDAQAQKAFMFTFGTGGPIMVFNGYVGFAGAPTGSAQDKVVSPAVITAFGSPTYYAS